MKKLLYKNAYYLMNKYKSSKNKQLLKKYKNKHFIINIDEKVVKKELEKKRKKRLVNYTIINQKEEKDLSIIIPIYNCENSIEKCLNSIVNQNLSMNYEIICVNDGSTDNSLSIIEKYASNNNNIKVFSQKNKGSSSARNTGLNSAFGKYILFIDSDDFLCENSLNYYFNKVLDNNADIIIGRICKYREKSNTMFPLRYNRRVNNFIDLCNNTTGTAWGKIYKRELWNDIRFFEGYMYEDSIIFLNIFLKANKIISDSRPMYAFRSSNNSLFKKSKKNYATLDMLWQIDVMNEIGYFNDLNINQFQVVLWNLSVMIFERIGCLEDDEILKYSFVKSKYIFNSIRNKNSNLKLDFYGKNKNNYSKIIEAYTKSDFYMWKYYCGIINYSNKI